MGLEKERPPAQIVCTYDYRDEAGELLSQVVRLDPKSFRQRRPDDSGGWIWRLGDVRRVLYRLPELKRKKAVVIVEGEKDADALWALKIPATTNLGGASAWRPALVENLTWAGVKRVVILPDNDAPGRKHARAVARDCHAAGIEVTICNLPGLPEKGDVSDFLAAAEYPKGDLVRAVQAHGVKWTGEEREPEEPAALGTAAYHGLIARKMSEVQARDTNWLWPDRIPRGELTLVVGDPSVGKTFITQYLSVCSADGLSWPMSDLQADKRSVVYLTVEDNPETSMKPRMLAMGLKDEESVILIEGARSEEGDRLINLVDDLPRIEEVCRDAKAGMLVISPINAYLAGKRGKPLDGYRETDVRSVLTPIVQLAQRLDLAAIGVTHLSKAQQTQVLYRVGGSISFSAVPRIVYCVMRDKEDVNKRYFAVAKANDMKEPKTLEFHIESAPGLKIGRIVFDGEGDKMLPELMRESEKKQGSKKQEKEERRQAMVKWLRFLLEPGPRTPQQVIEAGWEAGKYRAKELTERHRDGFDLAEVAGVEKVSQGGHGKPWLWKMKTEAKSE